MAGYLLSLHTIEGEASEAMSDEERQQSWKNTQALNEELKSAGAFLFGGALHGPDTVSNIQLAAGRA